MERTYAHSFVYSIELGDQRFESWHSKCQFSVFQPGLGNNKYEEKFSVEDKAYLH